MLRVHTKKPPPVCKTEDGKRKKIYTHIIGQKVRFVKMKTAKCRDAPELFTREKAAAELGVSPYWISRLVRENKLSKDEHGCIPESSLRAFQRSNTHKIKEAQADLIRAYEIGLSMNLIEIIADNAIRYKSLLLPGKPTARQFTYQTIYTYVMGKKNKEENQNG